MWKILVQPPCVNQREYRDLNLGYLCLTAVSWFTSICNVLPKSAHIQLQEFISLWILYGFGFREVHFSIWIPGCWWLSGCRSVSLLPEPVPVSFLFLQPAQSREKNTKFVEFRSHQKKKGKAAMFRYLFQSYSEAWTGISGGALLFYQPSEGWLKEGFLHLHVQSSLYWNISDTALPIAIVQCQDLEAKISRDVS